MNTLQKQFGLMLLTGSTTAINIITIHLIGSGLHVGWLIFCLGLFGLLSHLKVKNFQEHNNRPHSPGSRKKQRH